MNGIEQLYHDYFKDVYLYVKSLSHNDIIAEEITAETFFKAMKNLDTFKGDCDIRVWLCQIAKNSYFTYLKKHSKEVLYENIMVENQTKDIITEISNKETSKTIHSYLHTLKEPYKEVFTLRIFAELNFKDIGDLFGKTENWACVTYYRAKNKLKKQMEDYE